MATSPSKIASPVVIGGSLTLGGALAQTGDIDLTGDLDQTGDLTLTGILDVTGAINHTGALTTSGTLSIGATPITLIDNTTKVTVNKDVEATGNLLASGYVYVTHAVLTKPAATLADGAIVATLAEGVYQVYVSTTGAGGPYALTLGANNGVNHRVFVKMTAHDTSDVTIVSAEGTTTLDAANECAEFVYDGAAWHCISYIGTTGPA